MKYNFDRVLDRSNSNSVKWNTDEVKKDKGILPMWIADMDFKVSDEILEALKEPIDHGVLGYNIIPDSFYDSIINWVDKKHKWKIKREWISFIPGIVPGISVALNEFTDEGDEVLIQPPVYHPFYRVAKNNDRKIIENPLGLVDGEYKMDLKDMKDKIGEKTKLAVLCSPHNPVGRAWTKDELEEFGEICVKKNIIIVSDEIHSDLVFNNNVHTPTAKVSDDIKMNTITFMSPSKTFNIPGLYASVAIIPNDRLKNRFDKRLSKWEMGGANTFSIAGFTAAYEKGEEWLSEALEYIEDNIDFAVKYINENIKGVKTYKPDSTYLMWLDFNDTGKTQEQLENLLLEKGKVMLNNGEMFGSGGEGFFRLNIACPRAMLEDGLKRIKKAVE